MQWRMLEEAVVVGDIAVVGIDSDMRVIVSAKSLMKMDVGA